MSDILKILKDLNIPYRYAGRENVKIHCLNPDHVDKEPSMLIHKDSGLINCFGCGMTGNIFTLLKNKGMSTGEMLTYLNNTTFKKKKEDEQSSNVSEIEKYLNERQRVLSGEKEEKNENEHVELPPNRKINSNFYLENQRGFTQEEIIFWDMRVITEGKSVGNILIPIYYKGKLHNYFIRSTFGSGKFYGPYPITNVLFGIDLATNFDDKIFVVEGIFDCIYLLRTQRQCVAALSNKLSDYQRNLLSRYKEIVIVPDTDDKGSLLITTAMSLRYSNKLSVCMLPQGKKDAAECTFEELLESVFYSEPVETYITKNIFRSVQNGTTPSQVV